MSTTHNGQRTTDKSFEDRLQQAKLDALKELAYGASHEINNPLANIAARAQTLLRGEVDPERRRALEAIHHQALRAHEMISDLMLFARPPRLELASVDPGKIVQQIAAEAASDCEARDIALAVEATPQRAEIQADAVQLAVAVKALVTNAAEVIGRAGRIVIRCAASDQLEFAAVVEVEDDGPGISEQTRVHLFDPFYSGREAGRGLGFGLSKAWRIVERHGGRISVDSQPGEGAKFTIALPPEPPAQ
jgi:signal transduction histidine kinase